jgi:hypothetical protein
MKFFIGSVKTAVSMSNLSVAVTWKIYEALKLLRPAELPDVENLISAAKKVSHNITTKINGVLIGYWSQFGVKSADVVKVFEVKEKALREEFDAILKQAMEEFFPELVSKIQ